MSVARVTEIIASSKSSFDKAVANGVKRANKTLKNVRGAWVDGQKVVVDDHSFLVKNAKDCQSCGPQKVGFCRLLL